MDPYNFYFNTPYGSDMDIIAFLTVFFAIYGIILLVMLAVALVMYILQSIAYYTIAKRRGIHNAWLAWIPVGNVWIIGSISDQYQYVKKGKIRNFRKWLIGLDLAVAAGAFLMYVPYIIMILSAGLDATGLITLALALLVVLMAFAMSAASIVYTVFLYMAIYDLFESCTQDRAVLYLLLSLFVPCAATILLFICRKKDDGMPPRVEELEEATE